MPHETAPPANLKRLKEDIARRVEQAPGPVQGPRKRIAVVAAKRLPQGKFPSSFMRRDSAKTLGARLVGGLLGGRERHTHARGTYRDPGASRPRSR